MVKAMAIASAAATGITAILSANPVLLACMMDAC